MTCDFWTFPKLIYALKAERFADSPDIQYQATLPRSIPQSDFQGFRQRHHRLTNYVASQAEYSEGDSSR
jgi:hypothetical protein